MPNWVYNNLTIAPNESEGGTVEDVAALIEQVGKPYTVTRQDWKTGEKSEHTVHEPFSFWNIDRPEGEDLEKYDESLGASGASPFWYTWNNSRWGVKWDASDVDIQDHAADHKQITFSTPWGPPLEGLTTLSQQHPKLHIELEWEEEQGFGGTFVFTNGEATETDAYDIPMSHADYVARDRGCYCESDPEEAPFTDCPTYVPEPSSDMMIPDDELEVEAVR